MCWIHRWYVQTAGGNIVIDSNATKVVAISSISVIKAPSTHVVFTANDGITKIIALTNPTIISTTTDKSSIIQ